MILRAIALLLWAAAPATAGSAADAARDAARLLADAAQTLGAARGASGRVAALTDVVSAYEAGLSALREGLRQVTVRQGAIDADLAVREAGIARLLGVLQSMERSPTPLLMLHPSGALGTARSSMMLGGLAPALQAEAEVLRRDLSRLRDLRALERSAADDLASGIAGIQEVRLALSEAIAERTDPPPRLAEDAERIAALLGRVETLEALAGGLAALPPTGADELALPLPLPVAGPVLRRAGEKDAAGILRPGLVVASAPGAQVSAPAPGSVRYAGPLLDYGNVVILEPKPNLLLVFAGLSEIFVRAGEILEAGAPLGHMGEVSPDGMEILRDTVADGGASRAETLYIEVRQGGRPVNPADYFATE